MSAIAGARLPAVAVGDLAEPRFAPDVAARIEATADVAHACLLEPDQWRASAVASTIDPLSGASPWPPYVERLRRRAR